MDVQLIVEFIFYGAGVAFLVLLTLLRHQVKPGGVIAAGLVFGPWVLWRVFAYATVPTETEAARLMWLVLSVYTFVSLIAEAIRVWVRRAGDRRRAQQVRNRLTEQERIAQAYDPFRPNR